MKTCLKKLKKMYYIIYENDEEIFKTEEKNV